MKDKTLFKGFKKKATYDSLTGYLDGGQERIKYSNRLATQLKNSHEMSDLLDNEGKGWFQENKEQTRRFTEQQVKETANTQNVQLQKTGKPKGTQRGEQGVRRPPDNPRTVPMAYDLFDTCDGDVVSLLPSHLV
jgi:hypothetical protein